MMNTHLGFLVVAAVFSNAALAQSTLPSETMPAQPSTGAQQYPELPIQPMQAPTYPAQPPSYPPPGESSGGSSDSMGGYRAPTETGGDASRLRFEAQPNIDSSESRPIPAAPPPMAVMTPITENDITYLCGGVGLEEVAQMKQAARDYDLMLTFAARDGSYLADVNVDIADARGKSLLKTTCDAPMMLVDLPRSGSYKLKAEAGGHTVSRTARVQGKERGKAVVMVWPRSATD